MNRSDTEDQIEIAPVAASVQQRSPSAQQQVPSVEQQPPGGHQQFLLCEQCRAPVDRDQRYCVQCGARQTHASNPAVAYFSAAASGRRSARGQSRPAGSLRAPVFGLFFVLLPLAVALGVLVGRSSSPSTNNDKLIGALLSQRPAAGSATPTGTAAVAGTSSGSLPSDFSLHSGFVVKLSTLPVQGTEASAVATAEQAARAKGAPQVGLINPKDFRTTPDQGAADYLIYSGEFKSRGAAQRALAKLKHSFPGAELIAVTAVGSSASAAAPAVVAHTAYGTVHKIAGSKPTAQQIQQDKQVVQRINKEVGKSYVNAQKGLPDTIAVTGNGSGSSGTSSSSTSPGGGEP